MIENLQVFVLFNFYTTLKIESRLLMATEDSRFILTGEILGNVVVYISS